MILTTLAYKVALFYHLLGIIPCTTRIRHEDGKREAGCKSARKKTQNSGYSQNQTYYYRNDNGKKLVLLHVIKEANDVVKGKANVTKEFAKTQRQIYKLISQMPQISAAQMSEDMGITNPRF